MLIDINKHINLFSKNKNKILTSFKTFKIETLDYSDTIKKVFINIGSDDGVMDLSIFIKMISYLTNINIENFTYIGQIMKRSIYIELNIKFIVQFINKLKNISRNDIRRCLKLIIKTSYKKNLANDFNKIICKIARSSL